MKISIRCWLNKKIIETKWVCFQSVFITKTRKFDKEDLMISGVHHIHHHESLESHGQQQQNVGGPAWLSPHSAQWQCLHTPRCRLCQQWSCTLDEESSWICALGSCYIVCQHVLDIEALSCILHGQHLSYGIHIHHDEQQHESHDQLHVSFCEPKMCKMC